MKKLVLGAISTVLLFLLYFLYINSNVSPHTEPVSAESAGKPLRPENIQTPVDSTNPFKINDEIKPQVLDESEKYASIELAKLNTQINFGNVSYLYFLDADNLIFSLYNGANKDNFEENYDLYRYDLKSDKLTLIATEYMLYVDSFVTVHSPENFSIIRNGSYLKVENSMVKYKRNLFQEAKLKHPYTSHVYYSEGNGQILILENDLVTKTNAVYVTDGNFSAAEKLPFVNAYSVQWADKNNVLVGYKEKNGQSFLAKYNLSNKSIVTTALPAKNYFIDPTVSDNDIVRFLYQEPESETPWGFLLLSKGAIDRIYFESSNPTSSVRNGKMAGFSQAGADRMVENRLFLYDIAAQSLTIRSDAVEFPQTLSVSPDGEKIIFVRNSAGKSTFYLNEKL